MFTTPFRLSASARRAKPRLHLLEQRLTPSLYTVTSLADVGAGSLRDAIQSANLNPGLDTINFDTGAGKFDSFKTINLSSGELGITETLTLTGPDYGVGIANVTAGNRVFSFAAATGAAMTFSHLTVSGGNTTSTGGAFLVGAEALTLIDSKVTDNTALRGSGVFVGSASGSVTLLASTIANNTATATFNGGGAGICLYSGGTLLVESSTLSGNSSPNAWGGGVYFFGSVGAGGFTIRNSTIAGNTALGSGGGIAVFNVSANSPTLQNCTIVGNTTQDYGGGVRLVGGTLDVESCIIAGNSGAKGGPDIFSPGTVNSKNSLIGNNSGFTRNDLGGNLAFGTDPLLGPLAGNGGPTLTMRPADNSPVIDKGSNPAALATDERGVSRTWGSAADIGAVEVPLATAVLNTNNAGAGSLRQLVADANLDRNAGASTASTITFDPTVFATAQTITLTTGELGITDHVTIIGPGANPLTISGNNASRVFEITSGATVDISDVTVTKGKASSDHGGGIYNTGTLTLTNSTISGNSASISGGGILNTGTLTLTNSTISGNSASGGGGIYHNSGTMTITNSTISGNSANFVGGINIFGVLHATNTIVAGNIGGDASGAFITNVNNLLNMSAAAAGLGTLGNYGGPTQTIPLLPGSPAIGGGSATTIPFDQRGAPFARTTGGKVDIGAFQSQQTFVVDENSDTVDGNYTIGRLSLREAMSLANLNPGPDTIAFDPTVFAAAQTITLTTGELGITDRVTVTGPGANLLTISGNNAGRIFSIDGPGTLDVTLSGLSLTKGNGVGAIASTNGGAIYSNGDNLTLSNCVIHHNSASFNGGALFVDLGGLLTITDSRITNNSAGNAGGGLLAIGGLVLSRCTVSDNEGALAGGLVSYTSLSILSSAITGNTAKSSYAGGIWIGAYFTAPAVIRNSTISGNSAPIWGGGVLLNNPFSGTLLLQNSTVTGNSAGTNGGGIHRAGGASVITAVSSIIAGNLSGGFATDVFTTGTANLTDCLLGSASGIGTPNYSGTTSGLIGKAPMLGPLADNGGPTLTRRLLPSSPAIGQGSNPAPALTVDQRGLPRVVGNIDIGAYEVQPAPTATVKIDSGNGQRSMIQSITFTFSEPVIFDSTAAAAITLQRLNTSTNPSPNGFVNLQFNPPAGPASTFTITFNDSTFAPLIGAATSLIDGQYRLLLDASQIKSAAGFEMLDGDGNGTGGDNKAEDFHRLFGDVNGDGFTDNVDLIAYRSANGSDSTMMNYNAAFDSNGDGFIDNVDFIAFRQRLGMTP